MQIEIRTVSGDVVRGTFGGDVIELHEALNAASGTIILESASTVGMLRAMENPTAQWTFVARHVESYRLVSR